MKHYIYIKCKLNNKNKILMKFYKNRINVFDIREDKNNLYLKIDKNDYQKVKTNIITSKFYYVTDSGVFYLKRLITPLKIISVILFLFFINFFSEFILNVNVIHENKEIRNLVKKELENQGIHPFTKKKNYNELQEIKKNILNKYKDNLEWLEIENIGMKYIIRVEERIINKENKENKFCHIVAKKSGVINKIKVYKGEVLVKEGEYVSVGDILLSGEIKFNEEVKNNLCASGEVYAEVWYQTSVSMNKNYPIYERTGKKRWNFSLGTNIGNFKIFKSRIKNYETEEKVIFKFLDFSLIKLTEYEVLENITNLSLEEAESIALKKGDENININLKNNEKILTRKVLKKSLNNSTIDIEIFYAVLENIGSVSEYFIEE